MQKSLIIESLAETEKVGLVLGKRGFVSGVICLEGDLGAGKTTLSQFIGLGVGVEEHITSPSFAILHEYIGRIPFYHMDFYRLSSCDEVIDLGFEDYFYGEGLCVIEWFIRAEELIPEDRLKISIISLDEKRRKFIFDYSQQGKWHDIIEEVIREVEQET